VELMRSTAPDIMYLATSDYIQHSFAPGSTEANRFYGVIDEHLSNFDSSGATTCVERLLKFELPEDRTGDLVVCSNS
jgi:phosphonoacetate hydrolase